MTCPKIFAERNKIIVVQQLVYYEDFEYKMIMEIMLKHLLKKKKICLYLYLIQYAEKIIIIHSATQLTMNSKSDKYTSDMFS